MSGSADEFAPDERVSATTGPERDVRSSEGRTRRDARDEKGSTKSKRKAAYPRPRTAQAYGAGVLLDARFADRAGISRDGAAVEQVAHPARAAAESGSSASDTWKPRAGRADGSGAAQVMEAGERSSSEASAGPAIRATTRRKRAGDARGTAVRPRAARTQRAAAGRLPEAASDESSEEQAGERFVAPTPGLGVAVQRPRRRGEREPGGGDEPPSSSDEDGGSPPRSPRDLDKPRDDGPQSTSSLWWGKRTIQE